MRTGLPRSERFEQTLLGQSEKARRLLALYTGEVGKKVVEGVAFCDVVEEGLDRYAGPGEARRAVHNFRIHTDYLIQTQFLYDAHFPIRIKRNASFAQALVAGAVRISADLLSRSAHLRRVRQSRKNRRLKKQVCATN